MSILTDNDSLLFSIVSAHGVVNYKLSGHDENGIDGHYQLVISSTSKIGCLENKEVIERRHMNKRAGKNSLGPVPTLQRISRAQLDGCREAY